MKVVIVGLPYFAKKIAEGISQIDTGNTYVAVDTSSGLLGKMTYVYHILFSEVLYFIGGQNQRGKVLKLAMFLRRRIVMHWVGTDVLNARKAYQEGCIDTELISVARHVCEVDWIKAELQEIGINAEILQIAYFPDDLQLPPPLPQTFSVLFYMGTGREKFYGLDKLIQLAGLFPNIPIRIVGASKCSLPLPLNVKLLGWVRDMDSEYRNSVLSLRLPEHDGLSFSVLEPLAYGRYVGYVYEFTGTKKVSTLEDIAAYVRDLSTLHAAGALQVNRPGYDFIVRNYSRTKVMRALMDVLVK